MFRYIKNFLILISIAVIFSCDNKVISETEQSSGVELSIPTISSEVKADLLKAAFKIDTRAIVGSQRIDYVVSSNGDVVTSSSVSGDDFRYSSLYIELVPGDYHIDVEVYNTFTSEESPMVSGSSDFTVNANQVTDVFIVAKPVNPTVITEVDTLVFDSNNFEPTIVDQFSNSVTVGSELWYEITPVSENLKINLDYEKPATTADFYFFIYDQNGFWVDSFTSLYEGSSLELFQAAGNTYYIAVVYIDFTGGDFIDHVGGLTLTMEEYIPVYTSISVSEEWTDIILTEGEILLFIAENLEPGKTYEVEVMDRYDSPELEADVMFQDYLGSNSYTSMPPRVTIEEGESSFEFYMRADYYPGSAKVRVVEWIDPNYVEPIEGYVAYIYNLQDDFYDVAKLSVIVTDDSGYESVIVDTLYLDYVEGQSRYVFYITEYENYIDYSVHMALLGTSDIVLFQDYSVSYSLEQNVEYVHINAPEIYLFDYPDVCIVGETITASTYVYDGLANYDMVFDSYTELGFSVEIVSQPTGSLLTNSDVFWAFNSDTSDLSDVIFSVTPDVEGDYVINLIVDNYYESRLREIRFSVAGLDEGVLNVTFE